MPISIEQRKRMAAAAAANGEKPSPAAIVAAVPACGSNVHSSKRTRVGRRGKPESGDVMTADQQALQRAAAAANAVAPASMMFGSPDDPLVYGAHVVDGRRMSFEPFAGSGDWAGEVLMATSIDAAGSPLRGALWPPSLNGSMMSGASRHASVGPHVQNHWSKWKERRGLESDGAMPNLFISYLISPTCIVGGGRSATPDVGTGDAAPDAGTGDVCWYRRSTCREPAGRDREHDDC